VPIASELKLRKISPERFGSLGLDEVWLQEQIARDPSLLNLGELEVVKKEKAQPAGGRIDFVMADSDSETRYEIEVMLGDTDASHIIRTIEYWDVERQRYPLLEHRAVIVAEGITARFFNVIRLLNRAVPIIAIQLSAFRVGDDVVLQFTRVLDTYEFGGEPEDESAEPTDRAYWERKANAESLAVIDAVKALVPGDAKIAYNKYHIALGTTGYNFCWFHPRKAATHCHMHLKVGVEKRPELLERLNEAGIDAKNQRSNSIRLYLSVKDIQGHRELITDVIRAAEEWFHR
jgi:hypothetical protein